MDNMQPMMPPPPYPWYEPIPPKPRREYTDTHRGLAWLSLLLGYLFWRWAVIGGAGVPAFTAVFAAVLTWFGWKTGGRRWAAVWPLLFSLPFLLFSPGALLALNTPVFWGLCAMSIYRTFEPTHHGLADPVRGLFSRPFGFFATGAEAMVSRPPADRPRKKWRPVLWGLLLALPLTAVVGALLMSADAAFSGLADWLLSPFDRWTVEWPLVIVRLMLAVPVAMYIFAACYGNTHPKAEEWSDEQWQNARQGLRQVSPTVLLTAGIPLCVLYLLFFLSQSAYYFSAFSGLLPETFTYAQYAREGFFQLCAVAVINLLVLVAIRVGCRREGDPLPRPLKMYSTVICGFTLLLIATAMRKMFLYIEQYGLTPLRVYTSWFMLLLAVVFVVLAITQFLPRLRPWRMLTTLFFVMFALLQFGNVNGFIARYNVEQYKAGQLPTVDTSLFYDLGDAAVPSAVELLEDGRMRESARSFLEDCKARWEGDDSWITFNFTTHRAKELVEDL